MKNLIIITVVALLVTGLVSFKSNFSKVTLSNHASMQEATDFTVPDDVKAILNNSCLPCHGADGNFFAKAKWNYDKMGEMKIRKVVSKLSKIISKVEKGKMPPSKYEKKYPDRNLTEIDKKVLIDWADSLTDSLVK